MFKEIQHQEVKNGLNSLQAVTQKIIKTNELIEKSHLVVQNVYANKNTVTLFKESFNHLQRLIDDLNVQRKSFFAKNGFLPAEFHHTLTMIKDKVVVTEDRLTFRNARYSISNSDLQQVCDNHNFMLLPMKAVEKSIVMEDELNEELKNQSDVFVLVHTNKLNLNDCLSASDTDLMNSIVPQKIVNKWESFVFQFPLYKEIHAQLDDLRTKDKILNSSFLKMGDMIKAVLKKQEEINFNVSSNLNILFKEVNNIAFERHYEKGLDKDRRIKVKDYNNPKYERVEEGVGEFINDWGYTDYERIVIRYVETFPLIDVVLYGQRYQNIVREDKVSNNLSYLFDMYMKNSEMKNKNLFEKAKNDAYMILKKDEGEFKVITTMRGVDNVMGMMLDKSLFLPMN